MILSCIVAMSENFVIGRDNDLPWHLPADLKRFKALTTGHSIIMGRKTYESIGRPLPRRTSVVLTRNHEFAEGLDEKAGVVVVGSLDEALERCQDYPGSDEAFVIGGHAVFAEALPRADRLYLTMVHEEVPGDVLFPSECLEGYELGSSERHEVDERHAYPYSFRVYNRLAMSQR